MRFSRRILKIRPSATLAAAAKARELKAKGIKVIDLTAGEPDFETPKKIKEACKKALNENWTKYGPVPGLLELRQAIAQRLKKDHGLNYSPEEIIVGCGAKHSIFVALQVLIDSGDEVIIPAPYWTSYPDQVMLADGKPVILAADEKTGFKITPQQLEKAINPKTKMLILNSPSNPTGACYSEEDLKAIGEICGQKNLWVLSDEIYIKLTYDELKQASFAEACPKLKDQTILVNGASKAYSMTGWRMGFAAGPKHLIDKMKIFQSQELTTIATFIQRACVSAFSNCEGEVAQMKKEFEKRRNLMFEKLTKIPGMTCFKPQGAFYLFPNVKSFKKPSQQLADYLLEEAHVAVVAGEGFGAPGYLRLSYACDTESITEGIQRIKEALKKSL